MATNEPQHLLTVWNPSYAADPLDDHLRILLHWGDEYRHGHCDEDEVYVWWAKLRSLNRERDRLPHHDEIVAIQGQIDAGIETHLYLTDYRSLYVANLDEITDDDLLEEDEESHMPAYYRTRRADFWFRLIDIRRIVSGDTLQVIEELKQLLNTHYWDRPVSLYGGMVNLPLVVKRHDARSWFPEATALTDRLLWAQLDAELRGETDRMGRELRDNLLGPPVWSALDLATRMFLGSAEATYRARRDDPTFDFSGPAVGYAKAVEAELNSLLFPALQPCVGGLQYGERIARLDGRSIDLGRTVPHQTLGGIRTMLEHDDTLKRGVKVAFHQDWKWLTGTLPHHLESIVALRNPAAHDSSVDAAAVATVRAQVLGIGSEGLITQLARIRLRSAGAG